MEEDHQFLKAFQAQRLRDTYSDFVDQPIYSATCDYFFNEVYGARDTRERDEAFQAFYSRISKVLGGEISEILGNMIALQKLTESLDLALLEQLREWQTDTPFDMEIYEKAYAACDNYETRVEQIDILLTCLRDGYRVFHRPGLGVGLKALHKFRKLQGQGMITGFLLRGYDALHPLPDIEPLAEAVDIRERQRLDRIYQSSF